MSSSLSFYCGSAPSGEKVVNALKLQASFSSIYPNSIKKYDHGKNHTIILTSNNEAYCFGNNFIGACGLSNAYMEINTPTLIPIPHKVPVRNISCGDAHSVVLDDKGNLYGFGDNSKSQVAFSSSKEKFVLEANTHSLYKGKVEQVECNSSSTVFLTKDGYLYLVGTNFSIRDKNNFAIATSPLRLGDFKITEFALGDDHLLARNVLGEVFCFGQNDSNQCFKIGSAQKTLSQSTLLSGFRIKSIACGAQFSLAVTQYGCVYAAGKNNYGQLGQGHNNTVNQPVTVSALHSKRIIKVGAGDEFSVFVTYDRQVYICGNLYKNSQQQFILTPILLEDPVLKSNSLRYIPLEITCTRDSFIFESEKDLLSPIINSSLSSSKDLKQDLSEEKMLPMIELFIQCKNLPNKDILSLTDPFYIAYMSFNDDKHWFQIERSEVIHDDLNPKFSKPLIIHDFLALSNPSIKNVYLKIDIFDEDDSDTERIEAQEVVGSVTFALSDVLETNVLEEKFCGGKATLQVLANPVNAACLSTCFYDNVNFHLRASDLAKMDFFGKSDPYYVVSRKLQDGSFQRIYRSETVMKKLNVEWNVANIPQQLFNNGDLNCEILVEIYDYDKHKQDDFMGSIRELFKDLKVAPKQDAPKTIQLEHCKKGSVQILSCNVKK